MRATWAKNNPPRAPLSSLNVRRPNWPFFARNLARIFERREENFFVAVHHFAYAEVASPAACSMRKLLPFGRALDQPAQRHNPGFRIVQPSDQARRFGPFRK